MPFALYVWGDRTILERGKILLQKSISSWLSSERKNWAALSIQKWLLEKKNTNRKHLFKTFVFMAWIPILVAPPSNQKNCHNFRFYCRQTLHNAIDCVHIQETKLICCGDWFE